MEAIRSNDPRLFELSARALAHLERVERPLRTAKSTTMIVHARFRFDGRVLSTYATGMRFENVEQIALSDLRLELIHPNNQETADFFKALSAREDNT